MANIVDDVPHHPARPNWVAPILEGPNRLATAVRQENTSPTSPTPYTATMSACCQRHNGSRPFHHAQLLAQPHYITPEHP
jgi:hypothetical protein